MRTFEEIERAFRCEHSAGAKDMMNSLRVALNKFEKGSNVESMYIREKFEGLKKYLKLVEEDMKT